MLCGFLRFRENVLGEYWLNSRPALKYIFLAYDSVSISKKVTDRFAGACMFHVQILGCFGL
jgi:hypothetical protein